MQRFQNPGNFSACREFGNLGFNLESGIQLKEFGIPLAIGIRNTSSTDFKESGIQYLESEIHSVESRIQRLSWVTLLSLHGAKLT